MFFAQISGVHLPDIRDVQEIAAPAVGQSVGLCTGDGHQTINRDMGLSENVGYIPNEITIEWG